MSETQVLHERVERVTVTIPAEVRERLDREVGRRAMESGRVTSRSAVAAELLERALVKTSNEAA